jgi:hypothetical protein
MKQTKKTTATNKKIYCNNGTTSNATNKNINCTQKHQLQHREKSAATTKKKDYCNSSTTAATSRKICYNNKKKLLQHLKHYYCNIRKTPVTTNPLRHRENPLQQ